MRLIVRTGWVWLLLLVLAGAQANETTEEAAKGLRPAQAASLQELEKTYTAIEAEVQREVLDEKQALIAGRVTAELEKRGLLAALQRKYLDLNGSSRADSDCLKVLQPPLLTFAIKHNNLALFNRFARIGDGRYTRPGDRFYRDVTGKTALMYAAEADNWTLIREIIPLNRRTGKFECLYSAGYVNACDDDGYTALMHASGKGHVDSVNYLLNAGADVTVKCEVARFDALALAESSGKGVVIEAVKRRLSELEQQRAEKSLGQRLFDKTLGNDNVSAWATIGLLVTLLLSLGVWLLNRSRLAALRRYLTDRYGSEMANRILADARFRNRQKRLYRMPHERLIVLVEGVHRRLAAQTPPEPQPRSEAAGSTLTRKGA